MGRGEWGEALILALEDNKKGRDTTPCLRITHYPYVILYHSRMGDDILESPNRTREGRTLTRFNPRRILSPLRLPIPPWSRMISR